VTAHDEEPRTWRRLGRERVVLTGLVEDALLDRPRNDVNRNLDAALFPVALEARAQTHQRVTGVVGVGRVRLDPWHHLLLEEAVDRRDVVERVRKHDVVDARHVDGVDADERDAVLLTKPATRVEQGARALGKHHVEVGVFHGLEGRLGRHRQVQPRVVAKGNARQRDVPRGKLTRLGVRIVGADDRDLVAARGHLPIEELRCVGRLESPIGVAIVARANTCKALRVFRS